MVQTRGESSRMATQAARTSGTSTDEVTALPRLVPGKPTQQFEIAEQEVVVTGSENVVTPVNEVEVDGIGEDNVVYPSGSRLWLNFAAMMLSCFLRGLDITVVAVAVPSITDEFQTVADIGWYSAVNGIVISSTCFFFGKIYSLFDVKRTYLLSIVVFWLGAIVCTFAPTSKMFIFGRALISLGAAWQGGGIMNQLNSSFPVHKHATVIGILMFTQTVSMVAAPIIGGGLIRKFGWRACFGINIPLHFLALGFTAYGMSNTTDNPDTRLPLWEKIKRLDVTGTLIFIPALTCLLIALQWGGTKYGWNDTCIIVLLVVSVSLLLAFSYLQYRLQDKAVLPPRILKQRSILAGAWFNACCDGVLAVTEYYIAIYLQGVRGLSPVRAGVLAIPMIVGVALANIASGTGIPIIGYYTPFMLFTSVVAPIASGLLTTLDLTSQLGKAAGLLALLGFALGLGMQGPMMAVSAMLKPADIAVGNAIITFGGGMGSALFVSAAAVLFQNRLGVEVQNYAPGYNATVIEKAGLSDIRGAIGQDRLQDVLMGYDRATVQTLYIPFALTLASIIGSGAMEWRSVKKKSA